MAIKQLNTTISQSPEGKSIAKIREIRGNTLVWNQLVQNGDFQSVNWWTKYASSTDYVVSNGAAEIHPTTSSVTKKGLYKSIAELGLIVGHKYYFAGSIKTTSGRNCYIGFCSLNGAFQSSVINNTSTYVYGARIIELTSESAEFAIRTNNSDTSSDTINAKDVILIDLTLMFGAGNEPSTVEEFESMFPNPYYSYNEGTLINVGGQTTLTWNQLLYAPSTAQTITDGGVTYTFNCDGSIKVNGTCSALPSNNVFRWADTNIIQGHYYYSNTGYEYLMLQLTNLGSYTIVSGKNNSRCIFKANSSNYPYFKICPTSTGLVYNNVLIHPVLIDLTTLFGIGNEPKTTNEFEAQFPEYKSYSNGEKITYNINSCIEVIGFNQWDEEWELGAYNKTTGEKIATTEKIRCKNFIPVLSSTEYFSNIAIQYALAYDASYFYLGQLEFTSTQGGRSFVTPSGCAFVTFNMASSYGLTYNHDICINLSDQSRNGTYEPYKKSTLPLNISTLTGKLNGEGESVIICSDGLKSAGSVYDYGIVENGYLTKIVKVIGEVDLGTLNWSYYTYGGYLYFETTTMPSAMPKIIENANALYNLVCPKYKSDTWSHIYNNVNDKLIGIYHNNRKFVVYDSSYSDAAIFKAAMNGVLLNYELATPQTYVLDTPIYMGYETGTTEKITPSNILQAPLIADIDYFSDAIKHIEFDSEKHCIRDERILGIDSEPTESSNNIITSGGVYDAIRNKKPLYTKTYTYKCKAASEAEAYIYFMNITPTSNEWATPWTVHYTLTIDCDTSEDANAKYCHGDYDVFVGCAGSSYYYHIFNKFYSSSYYPIYYHKLIYHNTEAKYNSYRDSHPAKAGVRVLSAWGSNTRTRKYTIKVYDYKNCVISFPDNIENHTTAYSSTYNNVVDLNATGIGLQESGDANTVPNQYYETYVSYRIHSSETPLYRYKIIGFDTNNRIVPVVITNQTDSTIINKTPCSIPMSVTKGLCLYYSTSSITATTSLVANSTIYRGYSSANGFVNYTFNEVFGRSSNSTMNLNLYLVGNYNASTDEFTLDTTNYTSFYKAIPTITEESELSNYCTSGKYYWHVGQCSQSDNVFNLYLDNPLFYYNGTKLVEARAKAVGEKEDKSNKVTSITSSSTNTQYPSAKAVYDHINTQLTSVLKYKGTIGTGGTVTSLPATHSVGDVYVVSTAGTYAEKACEVGDYIICKTAGTSANNAHWDVINGENQVENKSASLAAAGSSSTLATVDGTNITVTTPSTWTGVAKTGTVTSVTLKGTSPITVDSESALTTSGTRTISHANSGVTAGTYKSVTVDAKGHVTAGTNPTTLAGYGITDAAPAVSGGYLPLSGGVMQESATIKLKQYSGERTLTLSGNNIFHDLSTATGGYAGSFYSIRTKGTDNELYTTTGLGFYGDSSSEKGLKYLYFSAPGETYADPSIKVTVGGLATFKNQVTAAGFKTPNGTSSQFLKADGSIDSNTYLTSHQSLSNYVKLDPGAAEQTIKSSISSVNKGIINLYRSSGDYYTFLGFSNGTTEKYLGGIGFKSQADHELYLKAATSSNTPSTNYYKIWNENNHAAPGVTAGTAGSSTASSGSTLDVPYVTVNAAGHVTGYGTHTHTISGFSTTDTKNTAGSTDSSSKLFIIGATSQAANPQTYSQDTAYVGTDGHLYSNSKQVVNLSDTQALTNKTYNGYTLAGACAKAVVTTVDTSASLPTSNAVKTFVENKGYVTTDTKNTAGSTDTSSKIFLIGATSQAANPQTYSDNEVYATSGVLTTRSIQVGGTAATMQYNSTDNSIEFVFG